MIFTSSFSVCPLPESAAEFLYRPKEKDSHNHKMEKLFCIRCQIRDHAGDGASCTRGLQTIDAVFGYHACSNRNFQKRRCF